MKITNPLTKFNPLAGDLPFTARSTMVRATNAARKHLADMPLERIIAIGDEFLGAFPDFEDINPEEFAEVFMETRVLQPGLGSILDTENGERIGGQFEAAWTPLFTPEGITAIGELMGGEELLPVLAALLILQIAMLCDLEHQALSETKTPDFADTCLELSESLDVILWLYSTLEILEPGSELIAIKRRMIENRSKGGAAKNKMHKALKTECLRLYELNHQQFSDREAGKRIYEALPEAMQQTFRNDDPPHQIARWIGAHRKATKPAPEGQP